MTYTEILAEARRLSKTNSTRYTTADATASANRALKRINKIIQKSDARWQYHDSNNSSLSISTTALVANQQDYSLASYHKKIERIEILNENQTWNKLLPVDQTDLYNQSLTDFLKTAGDPVYYDLVGTSVFLYPKPDYSQNASLKVFFQQGPSLFLTSDTSKEPGFDSDFHDLVPLWMAYDYLWINVSEKAARKLETLISSMEDELAEAYALRNRDEKNPRITTRSSNHSFR